ncbi:MAG TPA: hypothetical protein IAB58_01185 [Candidatus Pelethosoma merdigallinarum]|nr:hypothetical protein [Candidatus Pelethosoma merdigallinarum]
MKRKLLIVGLISCSLLLTGCELDETSTSSDVDNTLSVGDKLVENQPTPTDIDYSLERYNLIKRAYWVNGMRDKARSLPSPISDMPLGYIVLLTDNGSVVGRFVVDGKVTSLNSYLTPDSEFYEQEYYGGGSSVGDGNHWLPDVDGSYGSNDDGIFFFTTDGKYIEWTGTYLYSDIPFEVDDPIVKVGE